MFWTSVNLSHKENSGKPVISRKPLKLDKRCVPTLILSRILLSYSQLTKLTSSWRGEESPLRHEEITLNQVSMRDSRSRVSRISRQPANAANALLNRNVCG